MKKICLKTFLRSVVLHGCGTWVINETETIFVEAYIPTLIGETRSIMNAVEHAIGHVMYNTTTKNRITLQKKMQSKDAKTAKNTEKFVYIQ